jgi:hypothetical protein
MRIIITENQNKSLKKTLRSLTNDVGLYPATKAVGGIENYVNILYDGDVEKMLPNLFDKIFDKLRLVPVNEWKNHFDWHNSKNEVAFEKNAWGKLFIYKCDEVKELLSIKSIILPLGWGNFVFYRSLINYLNKRYKEEFNEYPIKDINI